MYFYCVKLYKILCMGKIIFRFGLLAFVLLVLFQLSKYSLLLNGFRDEALIVQFAGLFILFGLVASRFIFKQKKEVIVEKVVTTRDDIDEAKVQALGISPREYEVLQEVAKGLSNQEIAKKLFISETTVKSHVSNLLAKLDAKRRTQAVSKAKEMGVL